MKTAALGKFIGPGSGPARSANNNVELNRFMNTPAFRIVRSTRTQAEADLLIGLLQAAGLHPSELDTFGHISLAGADVDFLVRVPTSELTEARAVLSEYDANVA